MKPFFNSRLPIVEAYMNQVSTLDMALTISNTGAFPSLLLDGNYKDIDNTFKKYKEIKGNCDFVTALGYYSITDENMIKIINENNVSHVELFRQLKDGYRLTLDEFFSDSIINAIKKIKRTTKILIRIYQPTPLYDLVDAYCLKGQESGGSTGALTVKELFDEQIKLTPSLNLIPYGGIGSPEQVKYYISKGASAVGIGSLFACCEESPVSEGTKKKIISASSKDLKKSSLNQNFLQMSDTLKNEDNWNRDKQLKEGVKGNGQQGFIYLGKSVDYINSIKTAKQIVDYLTSDL